MNTEYMLETLLALPPIIVGLLVAGPLWRSVSLPGPAYTSPRLEKKAARLTGIMIALSGLAGLLAGIAYGVQLEVLVLAYTQLTGWFALSPLLRREAVLEDMKEPVPPSIAAEKLVFPRWKQTMYFTILTVSALTEAIPVLRLHRILPYTIILSLLIPSIIALLLAVTLITAPETFWSPEGGFRSLEAGSIALSVTCILLGIILLTL